MLPAQTKEEDISNSPREHARKISERRWNMRTEPLLTSTAINSDFTERNFCLVIQKDVKQNLPVTPTERHVYCWREAAMETQGKKPILNSLLFFWTTAEHQLSTSSLAHFNKARNNLWVLLTVTSKYTAEPWEKAGYNLANLKHTGACTSLESSIWHRLMQKIHYATLLWITTYLIKILHQLKVVGYKRRSSAALSSPPPYYSLNNLHGRGRPPGREQ